MQFEWMILSIAAYCCCSLVHAGPTTIYRCVEAEQVIYSDRPCGMDAGAYEPNESRVSILEAAVPTATKPASSPAKTERLRAKGDARLTMPARADRCASIERQLREIRSRMRAGYNVKQGEHLRARQRKLAEQRRELKC